MVSPGVDIARLERRIRGREVASMFLDLLSESERRDAELLQALVEEFEKELPEQPQPPAPATRPARSLASLGAEQLTFGQYRGRELDSVPVSYLEWLLREQEDNVALLKSYLNHPDFLTRRGPDLAAEQNTDEDDAVESPENHV